MGDPVSGVDAWRIVAGIAVLFAAQLIIEGANVRNGVGPMWRMPRDRNMSVRDHVEFMVPMMLWFLAKALLEDGITYVLTRTFGWELEELTLGVLSIAVVLIAGALLSFPAHRICRMLAHK